ncbi:MAG: hypothetical protein ACRYFX_18910 [Janthinobacterium lividum]
MALGAGDVYSPQVPGLATVLGSGLSPTRIYQQEAYRQAAAVRQAGRAQVDAEKLQTPPTLNVNGSQWFQPEVDASAKQVYNKALEAYKALPLNEARNAVKALEAEHNGLTQRTADMGAAIDKVIATARANNLDEGKVREGFGRLLADPATGQPRSAKDIKADEFATFDQNPDYYNEQAVVQSFLKDLSQKQESDFTTAARPGQAGMSDSASSNIFANDGKGKILYTLDGRGNRVPKIANIQALEQAALQNPQMAALLRRNLENGQRPTASLLMGLGGEHVTDDQLEALNAQTNQNTPQERQVLADLLRPYGTIVEKQRELSPLAVPRPRAGAGAKGNNQAPYTQPTFDGAEQRYSLPNTPETTTTVYPGGTGPSAYLPLPYERSATAPRQDYATYGTPSPPPVDVTRDGKTANKHIESFTPGEFDIIGPNNTVEHRTQNKQPLSGYPGESHGAFVSEETGKILHPATTAEGIELVRTGKARLGVQFDFNTEKNENFAANLKGTTDRLMKETDRLGQPKYASRELAESEARKFLSIPTVRTTHLRTKENAATVDRLFGSNYRLHQEALDKETTRLRAGYKAPAPPSFLKIKPHTPSPAPRQAGGMFD